MKLPVGVPDVERLKQQADTYRQAIRKQQYMNNFMLYARMLYPLLVNGYPHLAVSQFLDSRGFGFRPYKMLLMPRGSLKTSLVTAKLMHRYQWNPNLRVLYDSATYAVAVKNVTGVRDQFENNPEHIAIFGQLGRKGGNTTWNEDEITINTRTNYGLREPSLSASGVDAPRNSLHYDIIVADDLHNELNTKTSDQINKVIEHFSLLFALLNPGGELWVVGTRWGVNDLYGHIIENLKDEFDTYIKSAYEPDGRLFLPSILSQKELALRKKILDAQDPSLFDGQYLNNPISRATAPFKFEYATFFDEGQEAEGLNIVMTVDPATSLKSSADYSAISIVGKDSDNELWDLEHWQDRVDSHDLIAKIFELHKKWNPVRSGMEAGALKNTIGPFLDDEMKRKNYFFVMEELKGWQESPSKKDRILRLAGYWRAGAVHLRRGLRDLVDQFIGFPSLKHDDLLDSFAYALEILAPGLPPDIKKKVGKDRQGNDIILSERDQQIWDNVDREAERLQKIKDGSAEGEEDINDHVFNLHSNIQENIQGEE